MIALDCPTFSTKSGRYFPKLTQNTLSGGKPIVTFTESTGEPENIPLEDLPPWVEKFQYLNFVDIDIDIDYKFAFNNLIRVLKPPNPAQNILEQQVKIYHQTGALISEGLLGYIIEEENSLNIDQDAKELIQESRWAIEQRKIKENFKIRASTIESVSDMLGSFSHRLNNDIEGIRAHF